MIVRRRMKERIADFTDFLAGQLNKFVAFLESAGHPVAAQSKFVNLAPTDPKVSNIALTGPYGSGKSSIIQSFIEEISQADAPYFPCGVRA